MLYVRPDTDASDKEESGELVIGRWDEEISAGT